MVTVGDEYDGRSDLAVNLGTLLVIYSKLAELISKVCAEDDLNVHPVGRNANTDVKYGDKLLTYADKLSALRCISGITWTCASLALSVSMASISSFSWQSSILRFNEVTKTFELRSLAISI
jgi:hypothetical protein